MKLRRTLISLALATPILLMAGVTRAQTFEFYPYDETNSQPLSAIAVAEWINRARCLCDAHDDSVDTATLYLRVRDSGGAYTNADVFFYLGDDCDNPAFPIGETCRQLAVINHMDFNSEQTIALPAHWVVQPLTGECVQQNGGSTTVYVILGDPNNTASATYTLRYDTAPPGAPMNVTAEAGAQAVTVRWDPPDTNSENIEYYDVLCTQSGSPVPDAFGSPSWMSTAEICGEELPPQDPDPDLVCGTVSTLSTELQIEGLDPTQEYSFAVVSVDELGNPSTVSEWATTAPTPPIHDPSPRPGGCACAAPLDQGTAAGTLATTLLLLLLMLGLSIRRRRDLPADTSRSRLDTGSV